MAISYPLAFPTVTGVAAVTLRGVNAVAISESPFTFKQQVIAHQGQRWEAEITLPPQKRATAETWAAFLMSLQGSRGTFLMGDPNAATARGSASTTAGTPVVNGASQTGQSLTVDGLPASATGYLLAGDYIQLGGGSSATLHKVLQNVDSNALGQATIELWPYVRTSPADGATILVSNAQGVFRLTNNQADWSIDSASVYGISFAAVEAVA
jgi:hypothetical protein